LNSEVRCGDNPDYILWVRRHIDGGSPRL